MVQFVGHLVRSRGRDSSKYSVASHLFEHDAVKWFEQGPIDQTGDPAGTKGRNLLKQTLVDAVTQPGISWKPPLAAQHHLSVVNLRDSPPVDQCAGYQRLGTLWTNFFTHKSSED